MRRPGHLALAFGLCLLVAALVVGWLSRTALELDRVAQDGARLAAHEEDARLALWRMDSALAPLLARENARPPAEYGGALAQAEAERPGEPELVLLHFQLTREGELSSPELARKGDTARAQERFRFLRERLHGSRRVEQLVDQLERNEQVNALLAQQAEDQQRQQVVAQRQQAVQALQNPPAQALAYQQAQSSKSSQEWQARNRYVRSNSLGNAYGNEPEAQAAAPGPARAEALTSALEAVWLGDALALVRRARVDGREVVQGCWLDWPALRGWLLAQVADLLPQASLEPVPVDPGARPEHLLASLPVRLLAGPLPPAEPGPLSPVWLGLALAWAALLGTALALGALLWGTAALSERRADFVSAVTHELRTPLTTFRMYTEMLTEGMVPDEARRQSYLGTLRREAERLGHLVENVLAYSRIERGRGPERAERVELAGLLERNLPRLRDRAAAAGMGVELAPVPAGLAARADPAAVEQVLFNLVDNACKYAAAAADKRILLSAAPAGRGVAVEVRDFGPGLDREARRGLFRPFSKSELRAANTAPGVGLGLALCRRLAREMGGDLRHRDAPGGGAAFTLELPGDG